MRIIQYEFNSAKDGYLLHVLFPESERILAHPLDEPGSLVQSLRLDGKLTFFFFHCDVTDSSGIPLKRQELSAALRSHSCHIINDEVTNISKGFLQGKLRSLGLPSTEAPQNGDPDELLIVKTQRNSGGSPEKNLSDSERELLKVSDHPVKRGPTRGYQCYRRQQVPNVFWKHSAFIVERCIENPDGRFMRGYILEDRAVISEAREPVLIKRMDRSSDRVNYLFVDNRPVSENNNLPLRVKCAFESMRNLTKSIGCAYGCVDFVIDADDNVFAVDLNTTPHWGSEQAPEVLTHLAEAFREVSYR